MLEADLFSFAYGCAAHTYSNYAKDILKIPGALKSLGFCTTISKFFSNRRLPRHHLNVKREEINPRPPTLKLFVQTRWKGSARLYACLIPNMEPIQVVCMKARANMIDIDLPENIYVVCKEKKTWALVQNWEPVLKEIACANDYIQGDLAPASDVY